jgi:hypothetical protein
MTSLYIKRFRRHPVTCDCSIHLKVAFLILNWIQVDDIPIIKIISPQESRGRKHNLCPPSAQNPVKRKTDKEEDSHQDSFR